jgi:hypothetical protein
MNYEQRFNLQKRLKEFKDSELIELKDCVLNKEICERNAIKEKERLKEIYQ